MLSSILLVIAFFAILLTTGESQTGSSVVESSKLSQLDYDEIDICEQAGGQPYVIKNFDTSNGLEVRCDISQFDNRML